MKRQLAELAAEEDAAVLRQKVISLGQQLNEKAAEGEEAASLDFLPPAPMSRASSDGEPAAELKF
jgi:hypothetical protein